MKINSFEIDLFNVTFEPLAGSTMTNILRLLSQNNFKIDPVGYPRIIYSIFLSFAMSPLRLYEKFKFDNKIINTEIKKDAIFIVGHWRTGSTYLHNMLSHDDQFRFPSTYQTVTPALFLSFIIFSKKHSKIIIKAKKSDLKRFWNVVWFLLSRNWLTSRN